jgi:helix-turn-helix resolvase-like protein
LTRSQSSTRSRVCRVSDAAREAPGHAPTPPDHGGVIEVCILSVSQPLPQYRVHCSLHSGQNLITVGVAGRYSNRSDLLEQLRKVVVILSRGGPEGDMGAEVAGESVVRSRRLRDRFSSEDLQSMIDLYQSGTTARQVAERFGVSLRSVKRLLYQHGVRRERCR